MKLRFCTTCYGWIADSVLQSVHTCTCNGRGLARAEDAPAPPAVIDDVPLAERKQDLSLLCVGCSQRFHNLPADAMEHPALALFFLCPSCKTVLDLAKATIHVAPDQRGRRAWAVLAKPSASFSDETTFLMGFQTGLFCGMQQPAKGR